jgi:hypothetical protein
MFDPSIQSLPAALSSNPRLRSFASPNANTAAQTFAGLGRKKTMIPVGDGNKKSARRRPHSGIKAELSLTSEQSKQQHFHQYTIPKCGT